MVTMRIRTRPFSVAARRLAPQTPAQTLLDDASRHWQSLVTPRVGESLVRDGFFVVQNAIHPALTKHLRDEMRYLHETDQLYANATHILLPGEPRPALLQKHHILETELVVPEVRQQVPALQWLFESQLVFQAIQSVTPTWLGLSDYMIKLQYNEGHGGCFPLHFDSYGDDGKCITAVLYLNDGWQDGDGGEIVLYPFPKQPERVVVRPRDGDMVLFSSQNMLHRVLPAKKPRYCLTTWLYSTTPSQQTTERRAHLYPSVDHGEQYDLQVLDKVFRSSFRRHLAKLAHRDEWSSSLMESHRQTNEFSSYMATHERELGLIENAANQMLAKFRAKDPVQPSRVPETASDLLSVLKTNDEYINTVKSMAIPWF